MSMLLESAMLAGWIGLAPPSLADGKLRVGVEWHAPVDCPGAELLSQRLEELLPGAELTARSPATSSRR